MPKWRDVTNQRFGRLTAIKYVGRKGNNTLWKCLCECGTKLVIPLNNFTSGNTKSCGCLKKELGPITASKSNKKRRRFKEYPELGKKYNYYIRNAKLRKIDWCINPEKFQSIVLNTTCFYCNTSEKIGVDRVDVTQPYTIENVVPCCTACNQAKNNRSISDFAAWVERIYNHLQAEKWSV